MSSSRKKLTLNSVSVNLGCGTCRKPKQLIGLIFNPKPKTRNATFQKHKLHRHTSSSSSTSTSTSIPRREEKYIDTSTSTTNTTPTTNTSFSPCYEKARKGFGRAGSEGVPVEKDSDDPYLDFRHSMLQMILENQIYSKDDLRELLNCFLQLNSPQHHGVIVRAFTEIWNGVFSVRSGSSPGFHLNRKSRDF